MTPEYRRERVHAKAEALLYRLFFDGKDMVERELRIESGQESGPWGVEIDRHMYKLAMMFEGWPQK